MCEQSFRCHETSLFLYLMYAKLLHSGKSLSTVLAPEQISGVIAHVRLQVRHSFELLENQSICCEWSQRKDKLRRFFMASNRSPNQECIPVGCVPPTAVAITGGRGVCLDQIPLNFPLGCGPGPDPPQLPPWVWAWTRSPSTSPLGVGLDQIPLNFPLGCGPGPNPPQLPPWVWAWTRSPSTSPLGVGLETPPGQIPLNFPLGCGLGNLQGMLGPDPSPGPGTPPGPATPPPPHCGQNDVCGRSQVKVKETVHAQRNSASHRYSDRYYFVLEYKDTLNFCTFIRLMGDRPICTKILSSNGLFPLPDSDSVSD